MHGQWQSCRDRLVTVMSQVWHVTVTPLNFEKCDKVVTVTPFIRNSTDLYFREWKSLLHIPTEMYHNYIHQYSKISWFGRIHSLQLLVPCKWKTCNSRPYEYQHWNNHPSQFDILSLWASSIINYSLRIILWQPYFTTTVDHSVWFLSNKVINPTILVLLRHFILEDKPGRNNS